MKKGTKPGFLLNGAERLQDMTVFPVPLKVTSEHGIIICGFQGCLEGGQCGTFTDHLRAFFPFLWTSLGERTKMRQAHCWVLCICPTLGCLRLKTDSSDRERKQLQTRNRPGPISLWNCCLLYNPEHTHSNYLQNHKTQFFGIYLYFV